MSISLSPLTDAQATDAEVASQLATIDARWRQVQRTAGRLVASVGTSSTDFPLAINGAFSANNTNFVPLWTYLDPAAGALGLTGRTTTLRLVAACAVSDTAPTVSATVGLYPISAFAGATTSANMTIGTVISGSIVTFTTPAADSISAESSSGDFTIASAGWYIVGIKPSAAMAANSNFYIVYHLDVKGA